MNAFRPGGCVIVMLAAVAGFAATGIAMTLGLQDVRAGGVGCIATGALLMALAGRDLRHRHGRMPGWGLLLAGVGIATFIWPNWFNERAKVSEHTSAVNEILDAGPSTGTSPLAEAKAAVYRTAVLDYEKQHVPLKGQEYRVSVFVELDAAEAGKVKKASVYVESNSLLFYGPERKRAVCELLIKKLQADFPQAACNAALRGSFKWGAKASSPGPGKLPVISLDSDKPNF